VNSARPNRPVTGRTVLYCLLGFFGVVFAMNLAMVKLAIDTLPGTDVDSAYKASLAYGREIEAAHAQEARRWSVLGHIDRNADGDAAISVEARDANNDPLTGLSFSALLSHPADKRADRSIGLNEAAAGIYRGRAAQVPPGQWDLVIEAERGGERMFLSRNRVMLK